MAGKQQFNEDGKPIKAWTTLEPNDQPIPIAQGQTKKEAVEGFIEKHEDEKNSNPEPKPIEPQAFKIVQVKLVRVTPQHFHESIIAAKQSTPPRSRWRVDIHELEDYKKDTCFLTEGGSCVAVEPTGNIISVCKNQADRATRGSDLLRKAIANGGDRLDAFGKVLYNFYTRNGFEPVSWTEFDENYAPEGWIPEYGKEPVIFYKYTGKKTIESYNDFISRVKPHADYDKAKDFRDGGIDE